MLVRSTVGEYHPERHASYTMYSVQNDPESHGVLQGKLGQQKRLMSWYIIEG